MPKKVVVASGYFNPLHYGHVSYLEKARDLGTSLIVIVNNDLQAAKRLGGGLQAAGARAGEAGSLVAVRLRCRAVIGSPRRWKGLGKEGS